MSTQKTGAAADRAIRESVCRNWHQIALSRLLCIVLQASYGSQTEKNVTIQFTKISLAHNTWNSIDIFFKKKVSTAFKAFTASVLQMRSIIGWCKHTGCWQIQSRVNQATGKLLNITHKSASTCSITIVWHMYGLRGTATWAPDRILFLQHMVATLGSIVNHAPVCVCYLINVWQGYLGTVLYCAFNWALYGSVICTLCVWGVTKATAWGAVCSSSQYKVRLWTSKGVYFLTL